MDETGGMVRERPFRSPHHTITRMAMIGGGLVAKPGEISLAHRGILFLDEMTEFNPSILNTLRQPLEDQQIQLIKNQCFYTFPAAFLLVGAANPCNAALFDND
jgi:magnesium chelatase family protein